MKKKNIPLIIVLTVLAACVILLPFGFSGDLLKNNQSYSNWTREIIVAGGKVSPGEAVCEFTIYKDGEYRLTYGWWPDEIKKNDIAKMSPSLCRFATTIRIVDSEGNKVFVTEGGAILADTVNYLKAGNYTAYYNHFTDRAAFVDYAKEYICVPDDAEALADGCGFENFGGDGTTIMRFELDWQRTDSDPVFGIWVFLFIVFALVVVILLVKVVARTDYDERQQVERGKAFRLGFFTLLVSQGLALCADDMGIFPVDGTVLNSVSIFAGILAYVICSIWHEAYFGINEKVRPAMIFFGLIGLLNIVIAVSAIYDGRMLVNGKLSVPAINAMCAIMFFAIFVTIFLKRISSKEDADSDDEE